MATTNTQVNYSDYVRKFWKLFCYTFGGVLLFFLLASWGFFGKMPSFDELENPDTNIATEIISSDGVTLGKFYKEKRKLFLPRYFPLYGRRYSALRVYGEWHENAVFTGNKSKTPGGCIDKREYKIRIEEIQDEE